jgi:hypothetical protein
MLRVELGALARLLGLVRLMLCSHTQVDGMLRVRSHPNLVGRLRCERGAPARLLGLLRLQVGALAQLRGLLRLELGVGSQLLGLLRLPLDELASLLGLLRLQRGLLA